MKLFIESVDRDEILRASEMGVICGVTADNARIIRGGRNFQDVMDEIASVTDGPVNSEIRAVTADAEGMIREGREIAARHPKMIVRIPMTVEGLKAVRVLSREGVRTNVTFVYSVNQALLAARAGASYVSPYIGRTDESGRAEMDLIRDIAVLFETHQIRTEIIAAGIRNPIHVRDAALAGAAIASVPYPVIVQMTMHPMTDQKMDRARADYLAACEYRKSMSDE